MPKVATVAGPVRTQGKSRSQHCKTQQSNNSSSHIASLVFLRLFGLVVSSNPRRRAKLQAHAISIKPRKYVGSTSQQARLFLMTLPNPH
jgi:hypothetical protein